MALHGGIDQYDRDSTITDFKNGVFKVLVSCRLDGVAEGRTWKDMCIPLIITKFQKSWTG
jgi:hypothetical protein